MLDELERAGRDQPHAMTNGRDWFFPDDLDAAKYYEEHYEARPVHPGPFADYFGILRPSAYASGLVGDVEVQVDQHGTVTIVEAARYVRICAELLPPREGWAIRMDGDCIVLAEQVWYLPVAQEQDGLVLICELVRDDRT